MKMYHLRFDHIGQCIKPSTYFFWIGKCVYIQNWAETDSVNDYVDVFVNFLWTELIWFQMLTFRIKM